MKDVKLTSAEEAVLQILWQKEQAFVKEIIAVMPEPKPAYSTVSTIIRILEQKGYVAHESFGKSHRYYPLLKKEEFTKSVLSHIMDNYFGGSFKKIVSFMSDSNNVSVQELDEVLKSLKKDDES